MRTPGPAQAVATTALALLAFAGNSVLCRLALGEGHASPAGFTAVRLGSGALVLGLLLAWRRTSVFGRGSWAGAALLFAYAAAFSFAYVRIDIATGALVLFGAVQLTLLGAALAAGQRLRARHWLGLGLAACGLAGLLLPRASPPVVAGFLLMALAGVAWGFYTLRGRGSREPLADTGGNFLRTLPMAALLLLPAGGAALHMEPRAWWLAAASGAFASGLGYAVWYRVLPALDPLLAGMVQLLVPVLAALGGALFAGERPGTGLLLAGAAILAGIALVSWPRRNGRA